MRAVIRRRRWLGWIVLAAALIATPFNVYNLVRSCDVDDAAFDAPVESGGVNVEPFSILGCAREYFMIDGTSVIVTAPFNGYPVIVASFFGGVVLIIASSRKPPPPKLPGGVSPDE